MSFTSANPSILRQQAPADFWLGEIARIWPNPISAAELAPVFHAAVARGEHPETLHMCAVNYVADLAKRATKSPTWPAERFYGPAGCYRDYLPHRR